MTLGSENEMDAGPHLLTLRIICYIILSNPPVVVRLLIFNTNNLAGLHSICQLVPFSCFYVTHLSKFLIVFFNKFEQNESQRNGAIFYGKLNKN